MKSKTLAVDDVISYGLVECLFTCPTVKYVSTPDISTHIGEALLQWVYTDDLKLAEDDTFLLELMKAATTYQLTALVHRYSWFTGAPGSQVLLVHRYSIAKVPIQVLTLGAKSKSDSDD